MTNAQIWVAIGLVLVTSVCAWALKRGGSAERYGAAAIFIGWMLSVLFQEHGRTGPGPIVIGIDIVLAVLFTGLLLVYRKLWLILLVSCQICAVAAHFVSLTERVGGWTYGTVIIIWGGWGHLISLTIGMALCEFAKYRRKAVTQRV